MKKIFSFLLVIAVVMSFSTVMTTASATDSVSTNTNINTLGSSGKVYFEKPSMWEGTTFYTHIWESENGTAFFGWQSKKEKMTEEDGKLYYDLSILSDPSAQLSGGLKPGVDYTIMFSDNLNNETCGLMFTTECIGDTAYVTSPDMSYENTEDSTRHSYLIAWKANGKKYGVPLQITSVGTIQGQFVTPERTPAKIINDWDKSYPSYPNEKAYSPQSSARNHKTRLAEIKKEITKMIKAGQIYYVGGGVFEGDVNPPKEDELGGSSIVGGSTNMGVSINTGGSSSVRTSPYLYPKKSVTIKSGATKKVAVKNGKAKSWSTSNKKVATVKNGKITALNKGKATVTATLTTGKKLTCKVTVTTAPKLSKTTVNVKKGETVTVKLSGKVSSINNKYTNTKVAKITSKTNATSLKIKGLKKGNTTLKIKVNGVKTLNLKVKVK
ncbi:MAG: Ig-like domain-containing protein [Oscillospiraceae bacterium]|nr:Ig-like domain-containing protein [Oscillospiraceae bacterium]